MKIMITFNQEELDAINNAVAGNDVKPKVHDTILKETHFVGNFGEFKSNTSSKEIIVDLETGFVKATCSLAMGFLNCIKTMICTCNSFSDCWFGNVKNLTKKEEEKAKQDKQVL